MRKFEIYAGAVYGIHTAAEMDARYGRCDACTGSCGTCMFHLNLAEPATWEDRGDWCADREPTPAEPETWYAVLMDRDDTDWGTGSRNLDEAREMAARMGASLIAVIDDGPDPVCVKLISLENQD